jgi:GT2 family glycosyltransferase
MSTHGTGAEGDATDGASTATGDFFAGIDDYTGPAEPDTRTFPRHLVTAVLVAHNGARWLPKTLTALRRVTRQPQLVVAVDTGSTDATSLLLAKALGASAVLTMPRDTGFGAAVHHAVDAGKNAPGLPTEPGTDGPAVHWLWLLHDDSAPDPESLRQLLAAVDASPSIAIAGPKVRGWSDPSQLVEVGLTVGGGGRRETGLERHELDQGQHDGRSDVLAVGSAGLLVRRDVWDALGGFDERITLFRDDLDLGWRANLAGHRVVVVPEAVVHHAEASAHGLRSADAVHGHVHRADRRAALHVILANAPLYSLPWQWFRLLVGSVLRCVGLLIGKAPREALDEFVGSASVLFVPLPLLRARAARARTRTVPARAVRHLLAPPMSGLRHGLESVAGLVSGRTDLSANSGSALDSGPTSEDADEMVVGPGRVRGLLERPGVQLGIGLVLASIAASRDLLYGSGLLQGGALLPSGPGAGSLWASYAAGWHDVGVGSPLAAPAYLVPLAALSTVLLGKVWLAVDLLLLLASPLAGIVAYYLLRRHVPGPRLRALAAVTYALLPAITGAVATGRMGTAVAAWLLPLAGALAAQAVGLGGWPGSLRRAWVAGLLLAVVVAFVPSVWLLALVAGCAGVGLYAWRSRAAWLRLLCVLAVPPLALLPWTWRVLREPATALLEAGAPSTALASAHLPGWHLAVANPGGPGVPSPWVTVPLLLAGLVALLRSDRHRLVVAAWVVSLSGLLAGLALSALTVTPASLGRPVHVWPGSATLLVGGGLVVAATVAADGARARLRSYRFGWRQPVVAAIAAIAVISPVLLALGWLVGGVSAPLTRDVADVLPAYVVASSVVPARPRALVLQAHPDGTTTYAVVPGQGRELGDGDVAPPADLTRGVSTSVSLLLSGRGGVEQITQLGTAGIGYLVVDAPVDAALERLLDGVPGLLRVSSIDRGAVWRLLPPGARVQLLRTGAAPVAVPADPTSRTTTVDADLPASGSGPAVLLLTEAADPGWRATADGVRLKGHVVDGWAQGFDLPASARHVTIRYVSSRSGWLVAQGLVVLVLVVLALPTRRRRGLGRLGDVDTDTDPENDTEGDTDPDTEPHAEPHDASAVTV